MSKDQSKRAKTPNEKAPEKKFTDDELAVLNDPVTLAAVEAASAQGGRRPRRRL